MFGGSQNIFWGETVLLAVTGNAVTASLANVYFSK